MTREILRFDTEVYLRMPTIIGIFLLLVSCGGKKPIPTNKKLDERANGFCLNTAPDRKCEFKTILFKFNSDSLEPEQLRDLDQNADCLNSTNDIIILEGHADPIGTDRYNYTLSDRRIASVEKYLLKKNVKINQIRRIPRGKMDSHGTDPASRSLERKVEITVPQPSSVSGVFISNNQTLCGDLDIIHPGTGVLDERDENLTGGLVALKRNKSSPVTQILLRRVGDGKTDSKYLVSYHSNGKIRIWEDAQMTKSVHQGMEFDANQTTTLYLEGITKSNTVGDEGVSISLKLKNGEIRKDVEKVRLTVVDAEYTIYLKMWIREQWVDVPRHPTANLRKSMIAGGDDRDNDTSPSASFRVSQKASIIAYAELAANGFALQSSSNMPGITTLYRKSTSLPSPTAPYSASNRFLPGAKPEEKDIPKTSGMIIEENQRTGDHVSVIKFHGKANDPLIWGSASIDWEFKVTIDATNILHPDYEVVVDHDNYPAYEIDIEYPDGHLAELYSWLHSLPSDLWALVPGGGIKTTKKDRLP